MKKTIFFILLSGLSGSLFASEWTCYRYVDGGPTGGYIKIYADSKYKAEKKALDKYRDDLGYRIDYAKCK